MDTHIDTPIDTPTTTTDTYIAHPTNILDATYWQLVKLWLKIAISLAIASPVIYFLAVIVWGILSGVDQALGEALRDATASN